MAQWFYAKNLTDGILRASFRESTLENPKPLGSEQVYEYKIDLWSTSNLFLKGHQIRLEVSSSNFPRFDRNLNTCKRAATDVVSVKATNTILHHGEHPSALILPALQR
jgi:putative CocE/NonD family hydrolase